MANGNREFFQLCFFFLFLAVTPLADYYVLGGTVYQCPDIWSIINSRLVSSIIIITPPPNLTQLLPNIKGHQTSV